MDWRCLVPGLAFGAVVAALALSPASAQAAFGPLGEDFRISFTGPDGDQNFDAKFPSVAYNPGVDEYLVVWADDDQSGQLFGHEQEIRAQRLSGTGAPLGGPIRVSQQGASGDPATQALEPAVAYNPASNEYLVVWQGEVGTGEEFEIWGQRLSAAGAEVGVNDFRISDMGLEPDLGFDAFDPRVAANSATGEYLVVWYGDDDTTELDDQEFEVFGQRLTAAGSETGANDFRISEQGSNGVPQTNVLAPGIAYNPAANEYLVVWEGEIGTSNDLEIWAQRLSATGGEVGGNDFQVSDIGFGAFENARGPAVTASPATGGYLVVWSGDGEGALVDDEFEIFGQRLTAAGAATGPDDFRISDAGGPDGNANFDAFTPSVAYNARADEYLVAWYGDEGEAPLVDDELEVWGQRLTGAGAEVGANDFRISDMGPDGNPNLDAAPGIDSRIPSIAANPSAREYLVVWRGDDGTPPLVDEEFEIFGRRLGLPAPILLTTDPGTPANDNNPRLKGTVDAGSTIDVFRSADCSGAPAVEAAPGADLGGAGISVPVADNTTTQLSATASSGGYRSRCSNSIPYTEQTPLPGQTPPPGPTSLPDTTAPTLTGLRVTPRRFARGRALPRLAALRRRATISFRLSEDATVRLRFQRSRPGRRVRGRCQRPTRRNRSARRCTRYLNVRGTITLNARQGTNRIVFAGRIDRRRSLRPGPHRARAVATDRAGNRSTTATARFTIARPRRQSR